MTRSPARPPGLPHPRLQRPDPAGTGRRGLGIRKAPTAVPGTCSFPQILPPEATPSRLRALGEQRREKRPARNALHSPDPAKAGIAFGPRQQRMTITRLPLSPREGIARHAAHMPEEDR